MSDDLSIIDQTALDAAYSLQIARDALKALYWSESDGRKSFHLLEATKALKQAASDLGYDLVEASKAEAA